MRPDDISFSDIEAVAFIIVAVVGKHSIKQKELGAHFVWTLRLHFPSVHTGIDRCKIAQLLIASKVDSQLAFSRGK